VGAVTGRVLFEEGDSPSEEFSVTARLEEVTRADAPATVVDERTTRHAAGTTPRYELHCASVDPRARYVVRIVAACGAARWTSYASHPVLTRGRTPRADVAVRRRR